MSGQLLLFQVYFAVCVGFLAGKDATSYLLKAKTDDGLSAARVTRWHRDGLILYILYLLPVMVWDHTHWWEIVIAWVFIRTIFFDIEFNAWAGLSTTYLGGTAWSDKIMVSIFGINGAVRKSVAAGIILFILNALYFKLWTVLR